MGYHSPGYWYMRELKASPDPVTPFTFDYEPVPPAEVAWRVDDGAIERGQWTVENPEGSSFVYVVPAWEGQATVESQRAFIRELRGAKKLAVRALLPNGDEETAVFQLGEFMSTPASSIPGGVLERCAVTGSALWDEWEPTDSDPRATTTTTTPMRHSDTSEELCQALGPPYTWVDTADPKCAPGYTNPTSTPTTTHAPTTT